MFTQIVATNRVWVVRIQRIMLDVNACGFARHDVETFRVGGDQLNAIALAEEALNAYALGNPGVAVAYSVTNWRADES